jgi:hypothetical protein
VDAPAMLSVPAGGFGSGCENVDGVGVTYNVGKAVVRGALTMQFGVAGASAGNANAGVVVPARDGNTLQKSTVSSYQTVGAQISAGIAKLSDQLCYNTFPAWISNYLSCGLITELGYGVFAPLNYNVRIQLAGVPSDFYPGTVSGTGPLLTVPIKIQLANALVGNTCYVGSNTDPIVVRLNQTTAPKSVVSQSDPNGYPVSLTRAGFSFASASDFAEPAATGCGPNGALNSMVNSQFGLPSAAGKNAVSIEEFITSAWTTAGGAVLSQAWHAFFG